MKEIKNLKKPGIYRESDEYIDRLVCRAVDKAIEDRKLHIVRAKKRKVILLAAATVLLLFSLGIAYLFQRAPDFSESHFTGFPSTSAVVQVPLTSTGRKVDETANRVATNVRSGAGNSPVKIHHPIHLMAHRPVQTHSGSAFEEVLNSIDDKDMKYVDCYEIEDIPEY
jgi:hypothetical protein